MVCDNSVWKSVIDYSATTGRVDVDIANDTGSCTAAKTGRLRYDDSDDEWEYCDGSDPWKQLGTGGSSAAPDCTDNSTVTCTLEATRSNDDPQFTAANIKSGVNILGVTGSLVTTSGSAVVDFKGPSDCPEIGNQCGDNSIYAGLHPTLNEWMFIHPNNQSNSRWSSESVATGATNPADGRLNQAWIVANKTIGNYQAFQRCAVLSGANELGHTDWYLPSSVELHQLWAVRAQINAGPGDDFVDGSTYWSSLESASTLAKGVDFTAAGGIGNSVKTNTAPDVRCMRREIPPDATACMPNPLCPNVGDVCDDGNAGTTNDPVFAGFMIYYDPNSADVGQCKPLFVTSADQSTGSLWKTSRGVDDIATDAHDDGKLNDAQIADSTTFPAFKLCKDLSDGGYTDWYLPARSELDLIWLNKSVIPAMTGASYFSSTESTADYARVLISGDFYTGGQDNMYYKNVNMRVRCVRRD